MPKRLLIVEPVATNRIRLAASLSAAHYDVETVSSLDDKAALIEPDMIVLGTGPDGLNGAEGALVPQQYQNTPVFCIDSDPTPMRRIKALRAGAREVLGRNLPDSLLLARLRSLIRESEASRECERRRVAAASFGFAEARSDFRPSFRIGCIGAKEDCARTVSLLSAILSHSVEYLSPDDVLREDASRHSPDAYVIIAETAHALEDLLPELRARSHLRHASVLVVFPQEADDVATTALNLGASDIAEVSSSGEEIAWRVDAMLERKHLQDQLRNSDEQSYRAAATDPLTGLYNRRYAEAYIADTLLSAHDSGQGFVMMLADIDHFKQVNDVHGHGAGDMVLCAVAERLRENVRACDLVSRHGGEEFLIVMPDTTEEEAGHTAERLRLAMASDPVVISDGARIDVTISIGVAAGKVPTAIPMQRTGTFDAPGASGPSVFGNVLEAADAALYRAKACGRNRVEFSVA
ncbi:MAG: diguanylate cyclase [Silicimonas sp.]|nr:diguanylate cyclase [Silicimonas sp.]